MDGKEADRTLGLLVKPPLSQAAGSPPEPPWRTGDAAEASAHWKRLGERRSQGRGELKPGRRRQSAEQSCCLPPPGFGLLVLRGQSHHCQLAVVCSSVQNTAKKTHHQTKKKKGGGGAGFQPWSKCLLRAEGLQCSTSAGLQQGCCLPDGSPRQYEYPSPPPAAPLRKELSKELAQCLLNLSLEELAKQSAGAPAQHPSPGRAVLPTPASRLLSCTGRERAEAVSANTSFTKRLYRAPCIKINIQGKKEWGRCRQQREGAGDAPCSPFSAAGSALPALCKHVPFFFLLCKHWAQTRPCVCKHDSPRSRVTAALKPLLAEPSRGQESCWHLSEAHHPTVPTPQRGTPGPPAA